MRAASYGVWFRELTSGPLLWHFENSAPRNGIGSIELSLDEVKELAGLVGFDIKVSWAKTTS
jgi:carnosine N-methyltransferase